MKEKKQCIFKVNNYFYNLLQKYFKYNYIKPK